MRWVWEIVIFPTCLSVKIFLLTERQHLTLNVQPLLLKKVLDNPLDNFDFKYVKTGKHLPVVLSHDQVKDRRTAMIH